MKNIDAAGNGEFPRSVQHRSYSIQLVFLTDASQLTFLPSGSTQVSNITQMSFL